MTITVADLLELTKNDPVHLKHLSDLAQRLNAIDQERAAIIAELETSGIIEKPVLQYPPGVRGAEFAPPAHLREPLVTDVSLAPRRALHRCSECGEEASVTVDGRWYCSSDDPTEK